MSTQEHKHSQEPLILSAQTRTVLRLILTSEMSYQLYARLFPDASNEEDAQFEADLERLRQWLIQEAQR